ncbi:zinc finger protein 830 [Procambarus clarkii]|uniref:zinc finger protein 830 n=1 Tax=Procambarus clarkii TaxID=6728 RepID=UPI001E672E0C|nr:zinc finger protein 830-like [Procambarus clarkii]
MSISRNKPQDIKQLMQEQLKTKAVTKQIDSPYAKYNSRGQLMCVVCGTVVKSAIIWQAHVNKRSHLENLTSLKKKQQQLNNQPLSSKSSSAKSSGQLKRPASPVAQSPNKRAATSASKPKGILKKVSINSSSDDSDEEEQKPVLATQIKEENGTTKEISNGVPEGFFDTEETPPKSQEDESIYQERPPKPKDPPKPNTTEVLPEGFFDDPVADAKARKVEYKDKDAEEWMSFMREVSAAEQESRMIIEEDKEEAALATQIEQANDQIACLERVVELDKKKTTQLKERGNQKADSDGSEDSSDEEFAPVIWRTKNSLI